jgi:hypothetical protein
MSRCQRDESERQLVPEDGQIQRPVVRRPTAQTAPVALDDMQRPLGRREIRPRREERSLTGFVDSGRGEVGQVRQLVLRRQTKYEPGSGQAETAQGPAVGEHAVILVLRPERGNWFAWY